MDKIQYYMNDKQKAQTEKSRRDFFSKKSLKVKTVTNGIILPAHDNPAKLWADGGVIDSKGNFITESGNGYLFGGKYDSGIKITKSNETVIFFGPFINHWGHFICDLIGRLWYIKDDPKKYKIAYCGWNWHQGDGDLTGNFLELLELLGCKKSQLINIQKPTQFKKIIIPELAFSGGNFYSKEFEEMINLIVQNSLKKDLPSPTKIYLSRTKFSNGKERGEEKIEKIFQTNGYKVVYPESLSVAEQITYFNKTQKIAMVSGSISHNLMFTRSNNVQAIILNKINLVNNYQLVIDQMTKANLTYIDSCFCPCQVLFGMGPFLLSTTKYLKQFLKDNSYIMPNSNTNLRDYLWYFKRYHEIYKIPANKALLNSQKASLKSSR